MNYQELFKESCYSKSLHTKGDNAALILWLLDKGVDKSVACGLMKNIASEWHRAIGTTCRHCGGEIGQKDFAIHTSYWWSYWFPCHKQCRDVGMKEEAYECQKIDANCNDCEFFVRGERIDKWSGRGKCSKYSRETLALVNTATGMPCFVHRKDK